jgi:hypothetical protein
MRRNQQEIAARIDAMPIEQARLEIASGTFGDIGSPNQLFAASWLSAKEKNLRDAGETNIKKPKKAAINLLSADIWHEIEREYDVTKRSTGKRINFIKDPFKRKIIFRDIEHAFVLANNGFTKPAVILAGGVIEELLRLYLIHMSVKPKRNSLESYIKACEDNGLLKTAIHKLADSVRQFRNIVHLERESSSRQTISKATAKGAVSSIFIIASDFT